MDVTLTGDSAVHHEPVAAVLFKIKQARKNFDDHVETHALNVDTLEWQGAHDAHLAWVKALIENNGEPGLAARRIDRAERALSQRITEIDRDQAGAYLRNSFLGRMGRFIEPAVKPLGWDWRIGTAAIASFPAREVVVATMGTIYNLGGSADETSASLRERMQDATWPDGSKVFTVPVALSLMVFFALCCQCGATLAVIKRETRSWRYPVLTFTYMTTLAYLAAMATYQIASRWV